MAGTCLAETSSNFAPLERWKAAIIAGDAGALKSFYSSEPPVRITVVTKGSAEGTPESETEFWAALKARRVQLNVSEFSSPQPDIHQINFEAVIKTALPGRTLYVLEAQIWQRQGAVWRLVATERTDPRRLEQPLTLDARLYPVGIDAREEIREALVRATKGHKNVLVVFGADWCYDCHVLDKAFRRPDIVPILNSNFVVVHVDVGQGDKNQDLMNQYQVPMSRGIPGIAVLDSNGKLIYSQRNGEFERARAMGPEDLLEFLKKWKPAVR
jgi:thioredoxin 1